VEERPRLSISRRCLPDYIALLREYNPFVPFELLFNCNDMMLFDWEERKQKSVLISGDRTITKLMALFVIRHCYGAFPHLVMHIVFSDCQ
jgi:hypothetical protein